jgi:hypothetical protein
MWNGRFYTNKQVEAYAVEQEGWLVITVFTCPEYYQDSCNFAG